MEDSSDRGGTQNEESEASRKPYCRPAVVGEGKFETLALACSDTMEECGPSPPS